MTYRLQHNLLETGEEMETFNTINEVKMRFYILINELTRIPTVMTRILPSSRSSLDCSHHMIKFRIPPLRQNSVSQR